MMDRLRNVLAAHAAVGAGAFAAAQLVLFAAAGDAPSTDGAGWFLNRGSNVIAIISAIATAAAIVNLAAPEVPAWRSVAAVAAGALTVMVVTLAAIGLGNLFPIVIAVGAVALAIGSAAGTVIGRSVRRAIAR